VSSDRHCAGAPNTDHSARQIYQQMPNQKGTTVHALQKKFQNVFGFTLPLFHGRGLLNCTRSDLTLLLTSVLLTLCVR